MRKTERPTIRDVARDAGVGTTTVSRVINGGKFVTPEIRRRVEEVILELRFQPSHAARSLKQERSNSIGLIVPRLTDYFFSNIASVAQRVCRSNRHILMISTSLDLEEQAIEELKVFDQQRVDGLIIVPPANQTAAFQAYCRQLGERTVAIDLPIKGCGISSVQTDNTAATTKATQHLIDHGRKRILFLASDPGLHTMQERTRGYVTAIEAAGLPILTCDNIDTLEATERAILDAYQSADSIDGLLLANGVLGIFAFQVLQKHNIPVPTRLAFITFDDFPLASMLRPAVTCVAQPMEEISRVATELLFSQIETPQSKPRHIRIPSKLILRESCGCPPSTD